MKNLKFLFLAFAVSLSIRAMAMEDPIERFFEAIDENDHKQIKCLIKSGVSINPQENNQYTPLHAAAHKGTTKIVKLLIKGGANIDAQGQDGHTPLYYAIWFENNDVAIKLINAYANPNIASSVDGQTVLHAAATKGNAFLTQLLINAGADLEKKDRDDLFLFGDTPFLTAVREHKIEPIKVLIAAGANVNAQDKTGNTALHILAKNPDYLKQDVEAIFLLSLLSFYCDPNVKNDSGKTAREIFFERINDNDSNNILDYLQKGGNYENYVYYCALAGKIKTFMHKTIKDCIECRPYKIEINVANEFFKSQIGLAKPRRKISGQSGNGKINNYN